MAQFTFKGDGTRVYPTVVCQGSVLVAESGQTYDLDAAPDELWVGVSGPQKAPEAVVSPATSEPVVSTPEPENEA